MNDAEKILVVEDEISLRESLAFTLQKQGYEVIAVSDGANALESARLSHPDLILLDLMIPKIDGTQVCKILRKEGFQNPILMVTAKADEIDKILGLEIGADDYISKPFSMRELVARVKSHLRRTASIRGELDRLRSSGESPEILEFDNLEINKTRREVTLDEKIVALKPQEYDLLLFFAEHKGQMLSREFILERVWGWDYIGDSRTVDVHVRWLRQKIELDASEPIRLVTVRGGGYRFEG
ncbi:MAG TPA: response regulator transcription factor [Anaerolineales bacterium]|nr:response regulator transcription factor [Anaerolineales bacterium]